MDGIEVSDPDDLAPGFAPQRHWTPDGGRSGARAKELVRVAMVEIFPPGWNCPASVGQRHIGSDLGFCLRVERQTVSRPGELTRDLASRPEAAMTGDLDSRLATKEGRLRRRCAGQSQAGWSRTH